MATKSLTIWCNGKFTTEANKTLIAGTLGHKLVFSKDSSASVLTSGQPDPLLTSADIAYGQPDPDQLFHCPQLRWAEVTTAGYTRFDRDDLRAHFKKSGMTFTNASHVFDEPCAQHVLAMILALPRQFLPPHKNQLPTSPLH